MWFRNIFRQKTDLDTGAGPADASQIDLSLTPQIYRQLDQLRLRSSRHLWGGGAGRRPSSRRRPASDFREHRKYVPGDDVRFVDWKASARHENFFLKQGEQPQENTIYILIDTSDSMRWGTPPKQDTALRLAAALGYLALANEDRLQVVPLINQGAIPLRIKGKGQFPTLLNYLRELPFHGRLNLGEKLKEFSRQYRGGAIYLLSDLLEVGDLARILRVIPAPNWQAVLFHLLHPHELQPEITGDFEMEDIETGQRTNYDITQKAIKEYDQHLQNWRRALEMACIQNKVLYTLLSTGWALDREIIPHIRKLRVLEPV